MYIFFGWIKKFLPQSGAGGEVDQIGKCQHLMVARFTSVFVSRRHAPAAHHVIRSVLVAVFAATLVAGAPLPLSAQTLPTGGSVAAGNATIGTPVNGTLNINQGSDQAIPNRNTFSVGTGGTVNFNQPSPASATLHRGNRPTPPSRARKRKPPGTGRTS